MKMVSNAPARPPRSHATTPPLDGALLRLVVDGSDWPEHLPPAPVGGRVTVSFSSDVMAARHGPALQALGYVLVGCHRAPRGSEPVAEFLISQGVLRAHATWWRSLADRADRAFNLAHGPARRLLAGSLAPHL